MMRKIKIAIYSFPPAAANAGKESDLLVRKKHVNLDKGRALGSQGGGQGGKKVLLRLLATKDVIMTHDANI
jgi:hypothetical protein